MGSDNCTTGSGPWERPCALFFAGMLCGGMIHLVLL